MTWAADWGWMWLAMAAFWLGVAALVYWIVRRGGRGSASDETQHARAILAERYARGDIDTEEYHERLAALR